MPRKSLILLALLAVLAADPLQAAPPPRLDADAMKAALKTARPEEDGFIDRVVARVEDGELPQSLVLSTFIWARKKPRWKFQYFRVGLIIRAARQGIRI